MSLRTLTLDATAKPIGLVPVHTAISRLAQVEQAHREASARGIDPSRLIPHQCQVLVSDKSRLYRSAGQFGLSRIKIPAPLIMMWPDWVPEWKELSRVDRKRVSRRVVFARDLFKCNYCNFEAAPGAALRQLTIDHVKPQHLFENREDATTYDNVVAACKACNFRKGGKLPMECGMYPHTTPKEPHYVQLRFAGRLNESQRDYVADYFKLDPTKVWF